MTLPVGLTLLQNSEGNGLRLGHPDGRRRAGDRAHPGGVRRAPALHRRRPDPGQRHRLTRSRSPSASPYHAVIQQPVTASSISRHTRKASPWLSNLDRQAFPGPGRRGRRRRSTGRLRRSVTPEARTTATEAADIDFSGVKPAASIDFWSNHPGKSQDVEKAIIEKFHAKYPDIKVNLVTAGANYEEIAQKFQTVPGRQVGPARRLWCSPTSGGSATSPNGSIIPVDALIKQLDIKVDDFQQVARG